MLDKATASLPKDIFIYSGVGLAAASAILHYAKQKRLGSTIASLAGSALLYGFYKKFSKNLETSAQESPAE